MSSKSKFKITYDNYDKMLDDVQKMNLPVDDDWAPTVKEIDDFLEGHEVNRKTVMFMEWIRMQPQLKTKEHKAVKRKVCNWLYSHVVLVEEKNAEKTTVV